MNGREGFRRFRRCIFRGEIFFTATQVGGRGGVEGFRRFRRCVLGESIFFRGVRSRVAWREDLSVINMNDQSSQELFHNWLPMSARASLEGRLLQQAKTGGMRTE